MDSQSDSNRPNLASKVPLLLELVNQAVPDCLVENYASLIESLVLPDLDDRHVLAAAIAGHADAIVTANLKDFPETVLAQHGIEAQHPDDFVKNPLELRPSEALEVIKRVRARMRNPARSVPELIELLEKSGLPQTAQYLKVHAGLI